MTELKRYMVFYINESSFEKMIPTYKIIYSNIDRKSKIIIGVNKCFHLGHNEYEAMQNARNFFSKLQDVGIFTVVDAVLLPDPYIR